jgi:glyoxylase-like metal-dependent hydrolase (beta-lactamase superfamily II)
MIYAAQPGTGFGKTVYVTAVAQDTYLIDPTADDEFSLHEIAYLLAGDRPVLIEPGSTANASRLLSRSAELGLKLDDLTYIIPTHIHVDHGGGAGFLAENLPASTVVLHPRGATHMADPAKLIQSTRLVFGDDFENLFGPILPIPGSRMHIAGDGEVLHLGNRDLTIVFAPGHASHHIAVFDSLTQGLFCGEALGIIPDGMPDFPLPAAVPPFELDLYLDTIARLAHLHPRLLFYSHCGLGTNTDMLIQQVRENTIAFAEIVREGVEQGESDQQIWDRLLHRIRQRFPGAELPAEYQMTLSGYLSYFARKQS